MPRIALCHFGDSLDPVCYISPSTQRGWGRRWNRPRHLHNCSWASWIRPNGATRSSGPWCSSPIARPQQRAQETDTHPDTVRTLQRRFRQQGMRGLLPGDIEVVPRKRTSPIPEAVRQEIDRLKVLYDGFHYRELARILFITFGTPIDPKTVKTLWQESSVVCQGRLALWDYHAQPDRYQARLQVIQLYYRGWDKVSISRVLHVSRPTGNAWIQRFETEQFAGLVDRSRAPKTPVRKMWLPLLVQVYHLQKAHPEAGEFRIWSLLARSDVSVRTIGRVMALNKLLYDDIPHVPKRGVQPVSGLHPYKASLGISTGSLTGVGWTLPSTACMVESDHPGGLFAHHVGGGDGPD